MARNLGLGPALALALLGALPSVATQRREIEPGLVAAVDERGELALEALPEPREGLLAFAARLCGGSDAADRIAAMNGNQRRLLAGVRYRVPFDCLDGDLKRRLLATLFSGDQVTTEGWLHQVPAVASPPASLWRIALWFTGDGGNYRAIREYNHLADENLEPRQRLVIPSSLLSPGLFTPPPRHGKAALAAPLEYRRDEHGEYAIYRLQPGEALYSSVVVRFTGHLFASDVNALAQEIARRSGIADVTDIPVGYEVKVPLDVLSPEFLPPGHPRRQEWERNLTETARYMNQVRAHDLTGITLILDAGHGGKDVGAARSGVWESLYVYDIMLRVERILSLGTAATVVGTTRDGANYTIEERDVLSFSQGHAVLTTPPYPIEQAEIGTSLRWYLSNSVYEKALQRERDPNKTVFVSIHADSLHPSLRGAMVYVPGLLPMPKTYGKSGSAFSSRKEVQERPQVSFQWKERTRSEGLSRDLAEHLLASFRRRELGIHPNQPIRDRVVRGRGRSWVPAVLRYNAVPAKVLIEVCNLSNEEDRRLIQTRAWRQRVAEAIADGILDYYGQGPDAIERAVVASADVGG